MEWKQRAEQKDSSQQEAAKEAEWKLREKEIQRYWQTVIIPKVRAECDQEKRAEIESIMKVQAVSEDLLEQWKEMFLPSIIEHEKQLAVDKFVQGQLPSILHHEYDNWTAQNQIKREELFREEWIKLEESKNEELSSKLKEIEISYQAQIIQWQ